MSSMTPMQNAVSILNTAPAIPSIDSSSCGPSLGACQDVSAAWSHQIMGPREVHGADLPGRELSRLLSGILLLFGVLGSCSIPIKPKKPVYHLFPGVSQQPRSGPTLRVVHTERGLSR